MTVDVKVKHNEDAENPRTEILVEEDDAILDPIAPECGPVGRAKNWVSNFIYGGRRTHCYEGQVQYPPEETVQISYVHHHGRHGQHPQHGRENHIYVDPSNPGYGIRNPHPGRWAKDKAEQWRDGVQREGHHAADKAEYYWDEAKADGRNLWNDAREEGREWKHDAERRVEEVENEARRLADQTRDKAGDSIESLRSSVRRIPDKAKEGIHRAEDLVKDTVDKVQGAAATATNYAKAEADRLRENAERLKDDVEDRLENAERAVKDNVREGVDNVQNAAKYAKNSAKEKLHHAHHRLREAGQDAKDEIHGAFNKAENAAESAWHKFENCLGCPPRRNDLSTFRREDLAGRYGNYYGNGYGWNPIPITAFYTALSTLGFLWLLRRVWLARRRAGVLVGDGSVELARELSKDVTVTTVNGGGKRQKSPSPPVSEDEEEPPVITTAHLHVENRTATKRLVSLIKAVDARNSYAMNTAFLLALMAIMELNHAARPLLHAMFAVYAFSVFAQSDAGKRALGPNWIIGPKTTFGVLLFPALATIYYALNCQVHF